LLTLYGPAVGGGVGGGAHQKGGPRTYTPNAPLTLCTAARCGVECLVKVSDEGRRSNFKIYTREEVVCVRLEGGREAAEN